MSDLVLTGANGFLGGHLLRSLKDSGKRIRALSRGQGIQDESGNVEWIIGDIADKGVWDRLVTPGCTVVNLAYSQTSTGEEALTASRVMSEACMRNSARRLIHCSTTSVYGRSAQGVVNEMTPCRPIDSYGRRKLAIEEELLKHASGYELVIIRPSSVFGVGGRALVKLSQSLLFGSNVKNYLRSCLFSTRRMHLVPVDTVARAIIYLTEVESSLHKERFIISADHEPNNDFRHVERTLVESFGLNNYVPPKVTLHLAVLKGLLLLMNKSEVDPQCVFSMRKLTDLGFSPLISLDTALREFASSYTEKTTIN